LGHYGLQYFFCGSGFLISFMILREYDKTGRFRMGFFYLRRIFRIWPAYYVLVLLVYLLIYHTSFFDLPGMSGAFAPHAHQAIWLFLLFLPHLSEFSFPAAPYLHHTYTIGIEEQFYLIWALLLKYFRKYFFVINLLILITGLLLALLHYLAFDWFNVHGLRILNQIATYYDYSQLTTFSIGTLLAYYLRSGHASLNWFKNRYIQMAFYLLFALLVYFNYRPPVWGPELMTILVSFILLFATFKETSLINYSWPIWEYLGKISYGVYLFHYVALVLVLKPMIVYWNWPLHNPFVFGGAITAVLLLAILLGMLSYYLIEKPFFGLKDRFSVQR
jgi:peptidoglycan/LPS O-acetylase OafA/YrhL